MSFSKTIQMYIFDGNSNGRIMCELSNWNGRIYKVSRSELDKFSQREDSNYTGVYFLFGKSDDNVDTIYVGEAEKIIVRLKQHINDKEYWNDCVVVISKDNALNKAHVKYLENKFYNLAKDSGRYDIINSTIPTQSSISEYDKAMLDEFIYNAKLLVSTLGYKAFETVQENAKQENTVNYYIKAVRGADAIGTVVADGFAVFKGSKIATKITASMLEAFKKKRKYLIDKEIIDSDFVFTKDYIFTSPSLAASIVMGRTANGRTEWKTKDNKTLADVEKETL